jgi:hypothetical protein
VHLEVFLIFGCDTVHDFACEVVDGDIIGPAPVILGVVVVDGLGPGVGDLLAEVGLILHPELGHHLLDRGRQLLRVKRDTCHVIDFALELRLVCFQELDGAVDTVIYVDHRKSCLGSEPALIVLLFKRMEEYLSRVISSAIEIILFTADDTRVADRAEVDPELAMIVFTNVFIEHLRYTVYGLGLQHCVYGGIIFREVFTAEYSDSRWDKDSHLSITSDIQSVDASIDVHVGGTVRESLTQSRENGRQMDDIIDFVIGDYLIVALGICHIQLLILAREVHLFV